MFENTDHNVARVRTISGITLTGKSHLLNALRIQPEFRTATIVRMDDITKKAFGDKVLTRTEMLYRNKLTRDEIEMQIVAKGAHTVLSEMPLLTRNNHQRPLAQMVKNAQQTLREMEKEKPKSERVGRPSVDLRVAMLFCTSETAFSRLARRNADPEDMSNSDVRTEDEYLRIARQFELPDPHTYNVLPVDTSDESEDGEDRVLNEVLNFFQGRDPDRRLVHDRLRTASRYLRQAKRIARGRQIAAHWEFARGLLRRS